MKASVGSALMSLDVDELNRFWGLGLARWQADPQTWTPVSDSWRITPSVAHELDLDLRQGP